MLHIRAFSHTSIIPKKMSPYSSLNKNNKALDLLNVSFQFYLKTNLPLLSKHYLIIHSAFYARAFFFQCIATQTLYYQASSTLDIHTETLPIGSNGFLLVWFVELHSALSLIEIKFMPQLYVFLWYVNKK